MRARGMTLLEMMITVAISSIMVAAAVTVGTSMVALMKGDSRKAAAEGQLALALSLIDRSLSNTGMGFSNPRFSFRVYDNVAAGSIPNLDSTTTSPVVASVGAATAGIIADTDVIEVSMSDSGLRRSGTVDNFSVCAASTCTIKLQTADPFLNAELGMSMAVGDGMFILVQDDLNPDNQWCLGRVLTVSNSSSPTVTFTHLKADMYSGATNGASDGCNLDTNKNPSVYVVERRLRFMVYQKAGGNDFGLYMATALPNGTFPDPTLTPPATMALGVENMQVRLAVGPRFDTLSMNNLLPGPPACTAGATQICVGNDPKGYLDPGVDPSPAHIQNFSVTGNWPTGLAYTKSALVELTAKAAPALGERRPASMNDAAGPIDNYRRARAAATAVLMLNGGLPTQ